MGRRAMNRERKLDRQVDRYLKHLYVGRVRGVETWRDHCGVAGLLWQPKYGSARPRPIKR